MRVSRRQFIRNTSLAAGFYFLPGTGRIEAKPLYTTGTEDYTGRLAYNENPLGPSPDAVDAMNGAALMGHRYPDINNSDLVNSIASHHGVNISQIALGAGATEMIRRVAEAFLTPGDEVIIPIPTYMQIEGDAAELGATVIYTGLDENYVIDLNAITQAVTSATKIIYLVNPNNPTGTIMNKDDLTDFIISLPEHVVTVVDEAYYHYAEGLRNFESAVKHVSAGRNVVVIRTFSKIYGLAGVRLGYTVSSSSLTGQIKANQFILGISRLTEAAGVAALNDTDHKQNTINVNNTSKVYLMTEVVKFGLEYITSETNFLMINLKRSAAEIVEAMEERGFIIRTGWGMPDYIRVTTGTMSEMEEFTTNLYIVLQTTGGERSSLPGTFSLSNIYPNPFNASCKISFNIAERGEVSLTIYDMLGRQVKTLINGSLVPGNYNLNWDAKNIFGQQVSSGNYLVLLRQGEYSLSKKITLLK